MPNIHPTAIVTDCDIADDVIVHPFCNLYGCRIGRGTRVGAYTEIGTGVQIGHHCKIEAKVFIPPGVTIEDSVFIGPGTVFTNDKHPRVAGPWTCLPTKVTAGASIGAGCVVLPGVTISGIVGAGAVVLRNVAPNEVYRNRLK